MAKKLTVVLSQAPRVDAARRNLEEQFVAALLMERGVELNVVEHIPNMEAGGTGLLCLEGLRGDLVVLAWMTPEETFSALRAVNVVGRPGRTRWFTPQVVDGSAQRILFCIDLRSAGVVGLTEEVRRIRAESAVATVGLAGLPSLGPIAAPAAARETAPTASAAPLPASPEPVAPPPAVRLPVIGMPVAPSASPAPVPAPLPPAPLDAESEARMDRDLDALMGEFDRLEL